MEELEKMIQEVSETGYSVLPGYYNHQQLSKLKQEVQSFIKVFYNAQELDRHSVYPSDQSTNRTSHAVMISEGESDLPKVDHYEYQQISGFLNDHHRILSKLTGEPVLPHERCLLNYQEYRSGSKPVGDHFDGEYLKADKEQDGIEFGLKEGILPRYVAVLVVENENEGKGIEIIDNHCQKVYKPSLYSGDLIVFDNIRLRHRVPEMLKPRISIGLRNFDHKAIHFAQSKDYFVEDHHYEEIPEGYISKQVNCSQRFEQFISREWPSIKDQYTSYV